MEKEIVLIHLSTWLRFAVRDESWIRAGELLQGFIEDSCNKRVTLVERITELHQTIMDHNVNSEEATQEDLYKYCLQISELDDLLKESAEQDRDHQKLIDRLSLHMQEFKLEGGDIGTE